MNSKLSAATRILSQDGPIELIRKTHQHYFCNKSVVSQPQKRHLAHFKNKRHLSIAEIGVWKGKNAEKLLEQLDIDQLFLIDPYDVYDQYPERKSDPDKMSTAQKQAHERLDEYSEVEWIEEYSTDAIDQINSELDYVFVDGNHHYKYVKKDIEAYYSLLKDDGMIAGDDANWIGVAQAVTEFALENNLQPHFEPKHSDWYFVKGRSIDTTKPLPYSVEANQITKDNHDV